MSLCPLLFGRRYEVIKAVQTACWHYQLTLESIYVVVLLQGQRIILVKCFVCVSSECAEQHSV